jgi:hypothetical protein
MQNDPAKEKIRVELERWQAERIRDTFHGFAPTRNMSASDYAIFELFQKALLCPTHE